ncbi:MAG: hypothetical protein HOD60_03990 [Candidatus Nitrosopelagicus sp.]|nr:hypothetical protein [Candidatus Nitrosopelagicus sp.]
MANILIGLVVVMFLSTAVYVGYHASQNYSEDAGGHHIPIDLNILETTPDLLQIIEKHDGYQSIISF